MISFDNVTKHYEDGTVVVDGLSFDAPTGKLTILVGPSGCGKTTTLRMINRLIEPSSGAIFLNGQSAAEMDVVQLRRRIGYVIQNAGLFPHKTIVDNVAVTARLNGASKAAARKTALGLLERVGLAPALAQRYPWQLSGGQQQRVGVALTLYALSLLVRTVCDGLDAVSPDTRQAAVALGYRPWQRFLQIELPVAIPVIAAGLRVVVVANVSIVSIAALVGAPQLGSLFTQGFQLHFLTPILAGIVLCIALALDGLVLALARRLTAWQPQRSRR